MKVCVVYNRESRRVINLFGVPNREKYGREIVGKIVQALRGNGHIVEAHEGDKDLISKLEDFMPRVLKGERPGMVFNLSYGIQGQARYTHVPSILEMVGIPYVGSGPLSHSLALDKVVSKMLFCQHNIPTPAFGVLEGKSFKAPRVRYPLIVKPKNEAVSFGLTLVSNEEELRRAANKIFDEFNQAALVEEYVEGKEINVGLLGNSPCEAFEPVEIVFPRKGPSIYTAEDKRGKSGREVKAVCPAKLNKELSQTAQKLALRTFKALQCSDCARVDMRVDKNGNIHVLELNSLPSLGLRSTYVRAAEQAGLDFDRLINRLVEVASSRYFGTPNPPVLVPARVAAEEQIFSYLTQRRDRIKNRLRRWVSLSSRTPDTMGRRQAFLAAKKAFGNLKMVERSDLSDPRYVCILETKTGLEGGSLLIIQMDIPLEDNVPVQSFRREPEQIYGEGVACSRGPLITALFALSAIRHIRQLHTKKIGVLLYSDEGLNCQHSKELIKSITSKCARVLVLRPGNPENSIVNDRRGERVYRLTVEGKPRRLDRKGSYPELLGWTCSNLERISQDSINRRRFSLATVSLQTLGFPMKLPHRINAKVLMTYSSTRCADQVYGEMKRQLTGGKFTCDIELLSERPPLPKRSINNKLYGKLADVAGMWDIPLDKQSSAWPSAGGLVDKTVPVICGVGPIGYNVYTPYESISRISLTQRTLLLAQFLAKHG